MLIVCGMIGPETRGIDMKFHFLFLTLLVGAVGLSGCSVKDPNDINKDLQRRLAEDRRENDRLIDNLKKSMEQGGQPGKVKVSGALIGENVKADPRITVSVKGGVGKDGVEASVAKEYLPVLSPSGEEVDLSDVSNLQNLLAVGCEDGWVRKFAEGRKLVIQDLPPPISNDVMILKAKAVVLCGKLDALKDFRILSVKVDELILASVDFTRVGFAGSSVFNANTLNLIGSNQITTKGIVASIGLSLAPSFELNIVEELVSEDDGRLLILSSGADYVKK